MSSVVIQRPSESNARFALGIEAEAIRVANDTECGLSSAVFSRNVERGVRVALQVKAGMAHVNDQPVNDLPNCPFGGEKNSGLGRSLQLDIHGDLLDSLYLYNKALISAAFNLDCTLDTRSKIG